MVSVCGFVFKLAATLCFLAAGVCHGVAGAHYGKRDVPTTGVAAIDDISIEQTHYALGIMVFLAALITLIGTCIGGLYPYINRGVGCCWFICYFIMSGMLTGVGGAYNVTESKTNNLTQDDKNTVVGAVAFLWLTACLVAVVLCIGSLVHLLMTMKSSDCCQKIADVAHTGGTGILAISYGLLFSDWKEEYDLKTDPMKAISILLSGKVPSFNRDTWNYFAMVGMAAIAASQALMCCQDDDDNNKKFNGGVNHV